MTDGSAQELAEASPAAFVNGSARPAAARPPTKIPSVRTTHREEPRQEEAVASIWASSSEFWRDALLTSCRVHEVLYSGYVAIMREQLAFAELVSCEALGAGHALISETDGERRTRVVSDYLRTNLERTVEHSAQLLELSTRPGGEVLQILAEANPPRA